MFKASGKLVGASCLRVVAERHSGPLSRERKSSSLLLHFSLDGDIFAYPDATIDPAAGEVAVNCLFHMAEGKFVGGCLDTFSLLISLEAASLEHDAVGIVEDELRRASERFPANFSLECVSLFGGCVVELIHAALNQKEVILEWLQDDRERSVEYANVPAGFAPQSLGGVDLARRGVALFGKHACQV